MSKAHITQADQVYYGKARYNRAYARQGRPGIQISPETYFQDFGAIVLADADGVSASQSVGAGANFLINGALATGGVATFDVPRNVVGAWTTNSILTITGTDEYGSILVEVGASAATFAGKKAFKTITSIVSSASITSATIGSGNVIGLKYRVNANGLIRASQTNTIDAATFVPADATAATGATGDVRGTVDFATDPDGTRTYAVFYKVADPSTKVGAFGVLQFGSTDAA